MHKARGARRYVRQDTYDLVRFYEPDPKKIALLELVERGEYLAHVGVVRRDEVAVHEVDGDRGLLRQRRSVLGEAVLAVCAEIHRLDGHRQPPPLPCTHVSV